MAFAPWLSLVFFLVSASARAEVYGSVRDAFSGEAIPGAIVRIQATPVKVFANAAGQYELPAFDPEGARIVAGAVGFFNEGSDAPNSGRLDFELERVPHDPHAPLAFMEPQECASCHQEQYRDWQTSAMAHAGRNTWVLDLHSGTGTPGGRGGFVYTRDSVHAGKNPASECASCHQPESWLETPDVALRPAGDSHPSVYRGVSCLTCHLMSSVDETRLSHPGFYKGAATINRGGGPVRYGTLGDVDYYAPYRMRASYQPQLPSVACAVCHQDSADPSGEGRFDGVVSEPTYGEWRESPYGDPSSPHFATCIGCHSEALDVPRASGLLKTPARPAGEVRSHRFEGTTARFLENAVKVELDARIEGDRLFVDVTLVNHATGHHVPTGVTMRNMILLVEALSDDGSLEHLGEQAVHEMGGVGDPREGYFAGLPGKLYGKLDRAADGTSPTFFSEAIEVVNDTRLPALASDETHYVFRVERPGAVQVRARVIYRRAWRAVVDAKGWTLDGHGRPLADLAPPHFGHLMASAETRVTVAREGCDCGAASPAALVLLLLPLLLRYRPNLK